VNEPGLISSCTYDAFVPEKFERWLNFPLRGLGGDETQFSKVWSRYAYTVVELGSFT
jgi:hypothetical protein